MSDMMIPLSEVVGMLKQIEAAFKDHTAICNSRLQSALLRVEQAIAAAGPQPSDVLKIVPADALPKTGLIGPMTAETGAKIMELLGKLGPVTDDLKAALHKHVVARFKVESLKKLNEAMGKQLVKDFSDVIDGNHQIDFAEDGRLRFSNWKE